MKDLPLLPSDYELFDWESSNGNATGIQTMVAYKAITTQGLTSDFNHLVWNDLVNKLSGALAAAGLVWDETYGTSADTKMSLSSPELTAKRFNAVAWNIENLINTNWKWAFDRSQRGYLGHARVSKNGFVYGWYFAELVRVLNLFLLVLKNEADFSEIAYGNIFRTSLYAPLIADPASALEYKKSILTPTHAGLYPGPVGLLRIDTKIQDIIHAALRPVALKRMTGSTIASTGQIARLIRQPAAEMEWQYSAETSCYASLKEAIYAARVRSMNLSHADSRADLSFYHSIELVAREIGKILDRAELIKVEPQAFQAKIIGNSQSNSQIELRESIGLLAEEMTRTIESADVCLRTPSHISASGISKSRLTADLWRRRPSVMYTMQNSYDRMSVTFRIVEPAPLKAALTSVSQRYAEAMKIKPLYFLGSEWSGTSTRAVIVPISPKTLGAVEHTRSREYAEAVKASAKHVECAETSNSISTGEIKRRTPKRIKAVSGAYTKVYAALTFDGVTEGWMPPVQSGSSLYIRSAYPQWKEDSSVHLDSGGVFYDPEQTDGNVYIRSNESMKEVVENG